VTEPDENDGFDSQAAAALLQQTTKDTRRSLEIRAPQLYGAWGVAWLIGLGAMWLSVRDQHPYTGPSSAGAIVLGALLVGAIVVTIATVGRASRGVHGQSEIQGRIFGFAWPIGFGAFYTMEGALARHGASAVVLGIAGAAGPLLVTGMVYLVGAAIWLDWPMFAMGTWLAAVVAAGVWTGPVTVLLIDAVAGGGGFLAMAGYLLWRRAR
jgi:hypothetical protein